MDTKKIVYIFNLAGDQKETFELVFDETTLEIVVDEPGLFPDWTRLEYLQCSNCPLSIDKAEYCPLAAAISGVVEKFNNILSYEEIFLEVQTEERTISQKTTAQKALGSYMGVLIAVCGCPHTTFFKPMARFHLPLATEQETIYRSVSMYLLAQYFCEKEGGKTDYSLSGLETIYNDIQIVNTGIVDRLHRASRADSSPNAIIMLDMYAKVMPYVIEDQVEELRHLFSTYIDTVITKK